MTVVDRVRRDGLPVFERPPPAIEVASGLNRRYPRKHGVDLSVSPDANRAHVCGRDVEHRATCRAWGHVPGKAQVFVPTEALTGNRQQAGIRTRNLTDSAVCSNQLSYYA